MKSNLKKSKESTQNKFKDTLNSQNKNTFNITYKDKKRNKNHNINNIINAQELSDIKTIVKNSVEKIYDLFNLQEMKNNTKILSRKSNDINLIKSNYIKNDDNDIKAINKYKRDNNNLKDENQFMKTNITFKINNYLSVLNKNKNDTNELNHGIINTLEDENSYLKKKYKDEILENKIYNISNNNAYKLKKNNNKNEFQKSITSKTNYSKNKNDIKNNFNSSKINKKNNYDIDKDNDYLFLIPKQNSKTNFDNGRYLNDNINNKNDESNIYIRDKSIIVNTKYKKEDITKNNYIIKPIKISHIHRVIDSTIINDGIINQSKEINNNCDSKNKSNSNSEKRKKYMFLKRTKTKTNGENEEKIMNKHLFFSQKTSKTKNIFPNLKKDNFNLYNSKNEFQLRKINNNQINENNDDFSYNKFENLKKNKLCLNSQNNNNKINKNQQPKFPSSNINKNITIKKNINSNLSKQNNYFQSLDKSISTNNIFFSNPNTPHYLSQKCKSDNKLRFSEPDFNKKKIICNKKRDSSSTGLKKENQMINLIYKKNLFNSINKKINTEERNKIRKTLKKLYDKEFPNKVVTNDIIKLFLLLNEYIINNNLLSDYNSYDNKNRLNKLSEILSKFSSINYPKEYDINIDDYINNVKTIQRTWRKYKIKKLLCKNEEVHELKKIIVNKCITKAGFKMKKIFGLFNSMIEDFNNIKNSDEINQMFYYVKNLIKRDLTTYEKNAIYKEFINNFIGLNNN